MKVDTKFSIGDKAFYIDWENFKVGFGKINAIMIQVNKKQEIEICYGFDTMPSCDMTDEEDVSLVGAEVCNRLESLTEES